VLAEQLPIFNQCIKIIELDTIFKEMPFSKEIEGKWH
jgi:hypothetical protein